MKSPTQYYRTLISSLRKANKITRGINKLGCETDLQHLKLQSYILLCHSALEQYIEDLGLAAAQEARAIYSRSGIITKTLVALISSKLIDDISEKSKSRLSADLSSDIEEFSKEAFNRYRSVVTSNNGIVDRDQKKLLIPIGVNPEAIDVVLMNNLHSFGAKRGDVAHKFKVQRTDTLTAVDTDLNTIVSGLASYDQAVCEALKYRVR
ncbi:HEPN domain-containing protein [Rheinheimera marina]|uniref:HEPN domain-containing protein n=1 Tax=Rheinheimera marina TaxID=1774958 RepID=A0ABV9JN40_9GAMM